MTYRRRHPVVAVAGLLTAVLAAALTAAVSTAGPAAARPATAGPATASATSLGGESSWAATLSDIDADDVNVAYRDGALQLGDPTGPVSGGRRNAAVAGTLVLPGHPLAEPARLVRATLVADPGRGTVEVEVRGVGTTGWSEWHRVPGDGVVLERAVSSVEVRVRLAVPVVLGRSAGHDAAPRVTALTLTATPVG